TIKSNALDNRTCSRAVPSRKAGNIAVRNVERRGTPVRNGCTINAAVYASVWNDWNSATKADKLTTARTRTVTDKSNFELFLNRLFSRIKVGFHKVDNFFLAASVHQFGAGQREHADNTRPIEYGRVEKFLRGDFDLIVPGKPLRLQLVELYRNA